jgi:hypothetical protein
MYDNRSMFWTVGHVTKHPEDIIKPCRWIAPGLLRDELQQRLQITPKSRCDL